MSNRNGAVRFFGGGINSAAYWVGTTLLSASHVLNDSSVTGTTVKDALNYLSTASTAVFPFIASGLAERDLVSYDASAGTWRNRPVHGALSGTGTSTISIGGSSNAKGVHDISIGSNAGSSAATVLATENIAIGFVALNSITDGNYNIGLGKRAGQLITTGNGNTIISQSVSAQGTVSGSNNTIIGYLATSSASADENSFFGYASGGASVGSRNLAAGSRALNSASAAVTDCVALGYNALTGVISSIAPSGSVAIGSTALQAVTTGLNTAVGFANQLAITTGTGNVTVGYNVMSNASVATATSGIVGIGGGCLTGALTVGANNAVAVGTNALAALTSGSQNCAVGYLALSSVTSSIANAAFGYNCLPVCTGASNTGVGALAGLGITSGASNVYVGASSGTTATTGSFNVAVGANATPGLTRSGCVVLGAGAAATTSDTLVIRMGNTSTKEIVITPVVDATLPTGAITYLPITIGGTDYRILLQVV